MIKIMIGNEVIGTIEADMSKVQHSKRTISYFDEIIAMSKTKEWQDYINGNNPKLGKNSRGVCKKNKKRKG